MGTAAQFEDRGKEQAECLFADPTARAEWYAEKRIIFLDTKIDLARKSLAALEAERAIAGAEWEAIRSGEREAENTDEGLGGYVKSLTETYRDENIAELDSERAVIDRVLDASGLKKRGWLIDAVKANDWGEYVLLFRSRDLPRPRNNPKRVLEALKVGLAAHTQSRLAGRSADECRNVAYAAYAEGVCDNGSLGAIKAMPIIEAFDAAAQAKRKAETSGCSPAECNEQAQQAFDAIMVGMDASAPPTGPPN